MTYLVTIPAAWIPTHLSDSGQQQTRRMYLRRRANLVSTRRAGREFVSSRTMHKTIVDYFNAVNSGNAAQMLQCFSEDVIAYTTGIPPRVGAHNVAQYVVDGTYPVKGRWTIDHCVMQGREAVVEWSMLIAQPEQTDEQFYRGIDWFDFDEQGRISQIREFTYSNPDLAGTELAEFPYAEKGYPTRTDLDSRLPNSH